ncbi:hypothetical protein FGO68_gene16415 [Halteria grandinella]|uniref:Uncharacterized protein n=1 Tax=Halteria grandinella TaxID=5974 RepID=A0A8J8NIT7_HALGN|nr:hypothetical protein FGO68_gene16415 [Halteria grandinella]
MMNGANFQVMIKDLTFLNEKSGVLLYNTVSQGKSMRIAINCNERILKPEYLNKEALIALGHPDVHKI